MDSFGKNYVCGLVSYVQGMEGWRRASVASTAAWRERERAIKSLENLLVPASLAVRGDTPWTASSKHKLDQAAAAQCFSPSRGNTALKVYTGRPQTLHTF